MSWVEVFRLPDGRTAVAGPFRTEAEAVDYTARLEGKLRVAQLRGHGELLSPVELERIAREIDGRLCTYATPDGPCDEVAAVGEQMCEAHQARADRAAAIAGSVSRG